MNIKNARKIVKTATVVFNQNTSIAKTTLGYRVRYHANGYTQYFSNFKNAYSFAREESYNRYVSL